MALTKIGRLVDKGIVKDQTNLGTQAADTDEYLLYDASADALKSIAASNVTPNETLITGKDAITIGNVSGDDVLLIYDTSAGVLKKITKSAFDALQPSFTSVSPSNLLSGDGTGNYTIVITGTDFDNTATFKLVTDGGTDIAMDTVTRDSSVQLTGTVAKSKANLTNANEPFDIVITNGNGLTNTSANAINIDAQPAWVTASGSLGGIYDGSRTGASFTVEATDPESGAITYAHVSGSLPGGLSLNTSTGVISGNADAAGSNTTSNFTIEARDANSNATERDFSIITYAPQVSSFTASGTFTVPTGMTAVDVLVVAGGGAGAGFGGGGGAGGLIYRPGFPITPGSPISVTVGPGGAGNTTYGESGGDSIFSTLTAKGGGAGGTRVSSPGSGASGGSGGGAGSQSAGSATQPTQPGDSGTYGFGNAGGTYGTGPSAESGGGGGGAGAAGQNGATRNAGDGGIGRAYSISGTSVYYSGGGAGGVHTVIGPVPGPNSPSSGGQGGGGPGGICSPINGTSGTANRGGGGGGSAGGSPASGSTGGNGGTGIVIVAY